MANREWYTAISDYYSSEAERHPEITEYKIQKGIFKHRVTCKDLGDLFANSSKGEVPRDFFQAKCQFYAHEIESWKDSLDPIFSDTKYQVRDSRMAVGNHADDSVGPFKPVVLYSGALSAFNFMCADYLAIRLILELKRSLILGLPLSEELPILTVELCRIFETIDSPLMPAEAILKAQGILGIASLFLPKDERHIQWVGTPTRNMSVFVSGLWFALDVAALSFPYQLGPILLSVPSHFVCSSSASQINQRRRLSFLSSV